MPAPRHSRLGEFRVAVWTDSPLCEIDASVATLFEAAVACPRDPPFVHAHRAGADVLEGVRDGGDLVAVALVDDQDLPGPRAAALQRAQALLEQFGAPDGGD